MMRPSVKREYRVKSEKITRGSGTIGTGHKERQVVASVNYCKDGTKSTHLFFRVQTKTRIRRHKGVPSVKFLCSSRSSGPILSGRCTSTTTTANASARSTTCVTGASTDIARGSNSPPRSWPSQLPPSARPLHDAYWVSKWSSSQGEGGREGKVFIFSNGSFVCWGLAEEDARLFRRDVLAPARAEVGTFAEPETEKLEFATDPS